MGIWFLGNGWTAAALSAWVVAALGPLSLIVFFAMGGGSRGTASESVSFDIDPRTVSRWATEALEGVAPGQEPEWVAPNHLMVSVPGGWQTAGEVIEIEINADEGLTVLNIESYCRRPQLIDYGKNAKNVQSVIEGMYRLAETQDGNRK